MIKHHNVFSVSHENKTDFSLYFFYGPSQYALWYLLLLNILGFSFMYLSLLKLIFKDIKIQNSNDHLLFGMLSIWCHLTVSTLKLWWPFKCFIFLNLSFVFIGFFLAQFLYHALFLWFHWVSQCSLREVSTSHF